MLNGTPRDLIYNDYKDSFYILHFGVFQHIKKSLGVIPCQINQGWKHTITNLADFFHHLLAQE